MAGMDKSQRKPIGVIGIINVGLSFLMPFVCVQFLLGWAWMYWQGDRWIEAAFAAPGLLMLVVYGISGAVGVINAVGYYRRKWGRQDK
jgi:hypothetical protein